MKKMTLYPVYKRPPSFRQCNRCAERKFIEKGYVCDACLPASKKARQSFTMKK